VIPNFRAPLSNVIPSHRSPSPIIFYESVGYVGKFLTD